MENDNELSKFIDDLELPQSVRDEVKKKYSSNSFMPELTSTKKMVSMSSEDGKKATIVLWEDDLVTVISTDENGKPHISSASSPEMYHIAQKYYVDLGLVIDSAEEGGKRIGAG